VEKVDRPSLMYYIILTLVPVEIVLFLLCILSILATGANVDMRTTVTALLLFVVAYTGETFSSYYLKISSYKTLYVKICRVVHILFCVMMLACFVAGCL
jgi:hypothetical protein